MKYYKNLELADIIYFCEIDLIEKVEQWLPVIGYEGFYEISDLGRVKSLRFGKEKILKLGSEKNKYFNVELWLNGIGKNRRVHQLVAESFLNHTPNKHLLVVNHKDFNKHNNILYNLEIITNRENTNKKHLKSSSIYTGVYKYKNKWRATIIISKKTVYLGVFEKEIDAHYAYENKLASIT